MGAWYWGLVKDQFTADDEVRRRVAEVTKGKTTERDKVARRLRLRRREDALRRARVRHPRLQAVPLLADLRAWLWRLQRQGDPHRHDAQGARHPGDDRDRAHGHEGRLRGLPREPRAVRSRHRVRPVARHVPRRHRRVLGHRATSPRWIAGRSRCRSTRASPSSCTSRIRPRARASRERRMEATLVSGRVGADRLATTVTGVYAPSWRVRYHAESLRKQRLQRTSRAICPASTCNPSRPPIWTTSRCPCSSTRRRRSARSADAIETC